MESIWCVCVYDLLACVLVLFSVTESYAARHFWMGNYDDDDDSDDDDDYGVAGRTLSRTAVI